MCDENRKQFNIRPTRNQFNRTTYYATCSTLKRFFILKQGMYIQLNKIKLKY